MTNEPTATAPDHTSLQPRLKRARGQLDGVLRMIDEGRYCVDILTQLSAVRAALRATEAEILQSHLQHCVRGALNSNDPEAAGEQIDELAQLFRKNLER